MAYVFFVLGGIVTCALAFYVSESQEDIKDFETIHYILTFFTWPFFSIYFFIMLLITLKNGH